MDTITFRLTVRRTALQDPGRRHYEAGWDAGENDVQSMLQSGLVCALDSRGFGTVNDPVVGEVRMTMSGSHGLSIHRNDTLIAFKSGRPVEWTPLAKIIESAIELSTTTIGDDEECDCGQLNAACQESAYISATVARLIDHAESIESDAWDHVDKILPEFDDDNNNGDDV